MENKLEIHSKEEFEQIKRDIAEARAERSAASEEKPIIIHIPTEADPNPDYKTVAAAL